MSTSDETAMPVRRLRNGLALTELGYGAAQLGNLYRETTDEEAAGAVRAAWEGGIRYFDTARTYGMGLSERRLGAALREYPRDAYVLSSKVGKRVVETPETAHLPRGDGWALPAASHDIAWDLSRDGILRTVEESLDATGLDRIDILYLHDVDERAEESLATGFPTLVELREQGVIRAVGAGLNQAELSAEFIRRADVDVMMVAGRFTLLEQGALDELLPLAQERGVGIVAASVFNSGLLSTDVVADDARYEYGPAGDDVRRRAAALAERCREAGVSLPAAALAYPLTHPAVVSVVVGARSAVQVEQNLARFRARMPEGLWRDLIAEGLVRDPAQGISEASG